MSIPLQIVTKFLLLGREKGGDPKPTPPYEACKQPPNPLQWAVYIPFLRVAQYLQASYAGGGLFHSLPSSEACKSLIILPTAWLNHPWEGLGRKDVASLPCPTDATA